MITFDKKGNPIIEQEATLIYNLSFGPIWHRFFQGFKNKKILGTRCPKCKRVLVPARGFCPRCFVKIDEWVEVSQQGILESWVLVNYEYYNMPIEPPYIVASIRLDGTDCSFIHMVGGFDLTNIDVVNKHIKIGDRVEAVWRKERYGNILDIEYFKPVKIKEH